MSAVAAVAEAEAEPAEACAAPDAAAAAVPAAEPAAASPSPASPLAAPVEEAVAASPPAASPEAQPGDEAADGEAPADAEAQEAAEGAPGAPAAAASGGDAGRGKGRGKGKGGRLPRILDELMLKVGAKGVLLPESRKTMLTRRREARALMPHQPAPVVALEQEGKGGKSKKKQRGKQQRLGVLLDGDESLLFQGAHAGEPSTCREALKSGVDVNVRTKADLDGVGTGSTALHIAASRGHDEVVIELLKAGADPSLATGRGELPIQLATRLGHVGVVRALSTVSAQAMNAEGAMQLLRTAPTRGGEHMKRKMRAAITSGGGAGGGGRGGIPRNTPDKWRRSDGSSGVWEDKCEQGSADRQMRRVDDRHYDSGQAPRSLPPAPPPPPLGADSRAAKEEDEDAWRGGDSWRGDEDAWRGADAPTRPQAAGGDDGYRKGGKGGARRQKTGGRGGW